MTLAERIKEAMGTRTPAELARAAKVTPAAVTQWLDGTTKSLKAEKAALLEAETGYRAGWIVTGRGPKRLTDTGEPTDMDAESAELLAIFRLLSEPGRFVLTQSAHTLVSAGLTRGGALTSAQLAQIDSFRARASGSSYKRVKKHG